MKRTAFLLSILLLVTGITAAQQPFTINDVLALKRVADPRLSPDGQTVAFQIGTVDKAANRVINQIWTVRIDGTNPRQITSGTSSSSSPRWSPDGRQIAYISGGQVWRMEPDGGDKEQVTRISTGAANPVWSRDGRWIAFTSDVYPECTTDECNKNEDARVEASKVKARVTERLLFKHWDEWRERKRTHVFVVPSTGGAARDMTPGDYDSPPYGAASGVDYAFSADGQWLAVLRNPDKVEAISTNSDIYLVPLQGNAAPKHVTAGMGGYDASPVFTPDGRYLLFRSQPRATFEADRWRIMRYNLATGEMAELTRGFDQQVSEMVVTADSKTIYFNAGERGYEPIFTVPVEPDLRQRGATQVRKVVERVYATNLNISPDGRTLVFANNSLSAPNEVYRADATGGNVRAVTTTNDAALRAFNLRTPEELTWRGALGTEIHGFLVKPANFDASKKYPLIVLIHGGPQGAWNNAWSNRWNPQLWANQGYIIFMPNPRGSTGYGQRFVDEISKDWGGKVYTDIMNGAVKVAAIPFIDRNRIGAAGASYGGYMVNWLLGHNNHPQVKFKVFHSHAGVYNLESMATATEEIWFVNWEFGGMPWENSVHYTRWSPHRFARNFNTPTLVTHGELDFRVPVDQSLQLYTTLQLRNVPSRLVIFPDEGHWILKPQNSEFWHNEVFNWFKKYLNP
jgi:dipeptidyl aminopeptidase/acylaminoacyl peptidase